MRQVAVLVAILSVSACSALKKSAPTDLPVIATFVAAPASGKAPLAVDLRWDVTKAERCALTPIVGDVPCAGSASVTVTASTIYTLTARNAQGGQSARTVSITIIP
jgi:hypothetical protein